VGMALSHIVMAPDAVARGRPRRGCPPRQVTSRTGRVTGTGAKVYRFGTGLVLAWLATH
jgi:hypothetical protein